MRRICKTFLHSFLCWFYAFSLVFLGTNSGFAQSVGSVTNLPIPRFVSLRDNKVYLRRGPSQVYKIDWVFQREGLPVQVVGEYGLWRRVMDRDGVTGWVYKGLLSGVRMAIVQSSMIDLRMTASPTAPVRARAERNAVLWIKSCRKNWCKLSSKRHSGWVQKTEFWGAFPEETF